MGMPIILDVHDDDVEESALERAFDWLRQVDSIFSTYRSDSEISRLNRGELELRDCSAAVRSVLARCERLRRATDGYFDHLAAAAWSDTCPDPGGSANTPVDPSGLVKGWSIDGVAQILERAGARNYCADAAGDMRLKGHPVDAPRWRVGIQHPSQQDSIAAMLEIADGAIATSGTYARGAHIVDPHHGVPPDGVLATTVVGHGDLATADAYATATFAMGRAGAQWAAERIRPYEAMFIYDDDTVLFTPGFSRWRA